MFLLMVIGTILLEMLPFTKSKIVDYVYIAIGKKKPQFNNMLKYFTLDI